MCKNTNLKIKLDIEQFFKKKIKSLINDEQNDSINI